MKTITLILIGLWMITPCAWGAYATMADSSPDISQDASAAARTHIFRQSIPDIAQSLIGMPYQYGGSPEITGTTDNSHLFFTIYTRAAEKAGLLFIDYQPMRFFLRNFVIVEETQVQVGDLILLNNNLAAMIYKKEKSGKIYCIYASEKRQKVLTFNSDNLVFGVYWLENLNDFYRLKEQTLQPAR